MTSLAASLAAELLDSELALAGTLHSSASGAVAIRALPARVEGVVELGGLQAAGASLVLDVGRLSGPEATLVEGEDGTDVEGDGGVPLGFDDALVLAKGDTVTFEDIVGTWTIGRATRQDPLTRLVRAELYRAD